MRRVVQGVLFLLITIAILTTFIILSVTRKHGLSASQVAQHILPHQIFSYLSTQEKNDVNRQIGMVGYYINLDRSESRREYMETQKKKLGCYSVRRMPGVDGRLLKSTQSSKLRSNDLVPFENKGFKFKSAGELGATLSHLKCVYDAWVSGTDMALIMEDDVSLAFLPFTNQTLRQIVENVPGDPHIVRIHYHKYPEEAGDYARMSDYSADGPYRWSAVAYIVTRAGMAQIMNRVFVQDKDESGNLKYDEDHGYPIGTFVLEKTKETPKGQADYFLYDAAGLDHVFTYNKCLVYTNNYDPTMNSTLHESHTPQHMEVTRQIFAQFIGA